VRGAATKPTARGRLRHAAYAGGWKKFEPFWNLLIRAKRAGHALPALEAILSGFGADDLRSPLTAGPGSAGPGGPAQGTTTEPPLLMRVRGGGSP
jgi:hypothetical protein